MLVRKHQPALLRTAVSRLGRRDWAEDAVQETFYCAFKSLAAYNSLYSFRTWLWTILLNQCRRRYQKERRRPEAGSQRESDGPPGIGDSSVLGEPVADRPAPGRTARTSLEAVVCSRPWPEEDAIAREQSQHLSRLLELLPESHADAIRLRFYGGLTFPEIAAALGCSLASAKNWVRLGLLRIASELTPADLAGAPAGACKDSSNGLGGSP